MLTRFGNRGDFIGKAQIKHTIGFVQDQGLQLRQIDAALINPVKQTTWRCHHEVRAFETLFLFEIRSATNDGCDAQATGVFHQINRIG